MKAVPIGKLVKPYGLKGLIKTDFFVDDLKELKVFTSFYLKDLKAPGGFKKIEILRISEIAGYTVVSLAGCSDRNQSELISRQDIFVDEAEFPKTKKNSYYIKDLIGCKVIFEDAVFGTVSNVFETAGKFMLVILMNDNKELAVPFQKGFFPEVAIDKREITALNLRDLL